MAGPGQQTSTKLLLLLFLTVSVHKACCQSCDYGQHLNGSQCIRDVRLVDSPRSHFGRLQFWHNGAWGEVCGQAHRAITEVACRHLGFLHVVGNLSQYAGYGEAFVAESTNSYSATTINIQDVQCTGEELSINDCNITLYTQQQLSAAGCGAGSTFMYMECNILRVKDIEIPSYQVVEVFQNGWNYTCGDPTLWGADETNLLGQWLGKTCQLAHDLAESDGPGYIAPSVFHCTEATTNLFNCYQEAVSCGIAAYAGVVCSSEARLTENGTIALLYKTQEYEVTLCNETQYQWGTGMRQHANSVANTSCRHAGYPGVRAVSFDNQVPTSMAALYPLASCPINATSLYQCNVDQPECPSPIVHSPSNSRFSRLVVDCNDRVKEITVRLPDRHYVSGFVTLWYGEWFRPNSHTWDAADTNVVCRQLGLPVVRGFRIVGADDEAAETFIDAYNEYRFDANCAASSYEKYHDCPVDYLTYHGTQSTAVQVICDDVRLTQMHGFAQNHKLVEYYVNDTHGWLPLCPTSNSYNTALVVCRSLGYSGFSWYYTNSVNLNATVFSLRCTGNEARLSQCQRYSNCHIVLYVECFDCACNFYEENDMCLPCPDGKLTVQAGATSPHQCYNMSHTERDCIFNTFTECLHNDMTCAFATAWGIPELSCLCAYIHDQCSFDNCNISDVNTVVDLKTGWTFRNCSSNTYIIGITQRKCNIPQEFPSFAKCLDLRNTNNLLMQALQECSVTQVFNISSSVPEICHEINALVDCYLNATFMSCTSEALREAAEYLLHIQHGRPIIPYCGYKVLDECAYGIHDCHPNATCSTTSNLYNCTCNDGYSGNGTVCADIDECSMEHDCHQEATCTNTDGSYQCSCNAGFSGNGSFCIEGCLPGEQGISTVDCVKCRKGYYKPDSGQQTCTSCGSQRTTHTTGSKHEDECINECAEGQYTAFSESRPEGYCAACPIDTYSSKPGAVYNCTDCGAFYFTKGEGSSSCLDICDIGRSYCMSNGTCIFDTVKKTPSCRCQVGFAGPKCKEKVTVYLVVDPLYGPRAGGTLVQVTGLHLNSTDGPQVEFNNIPCPLLNSSDTEILCQSVSVSNSTIGENLTVCITWQKTNRTICYDDGFYIYLPDPTVSNIFPLKSLIGGGTDVVVDGTNLMSVAKPLLKVTIIYGTFQASYSASCKHLNSSRLICDTPNITAPEEVRQALIRKSEGEANRRRRRQTGSQEDDELQILLSIQLDAVKDPKAQDVPFSVLADPEVERFEEPLVFQPFWPFSDRKFEIKGSGFTSDAALNGTLIVHIGSGQCLTVQPFDNIIECTMSGKKPPRAESDTDNKLAIQVTIGRRLKFYVGKMEFQENIFYYPPGRTGLIVGILLLFLTISVIVLYIRVRPKSSNMDNYDHIHFDRREKTIHYQRKPRKDEGLRRPPLGRPPWGRNYNQEASSIFSSSPCQQRFTPDSMTSRECGRRSPVDGLLRGNR